MGSIHDLRGKLLEQRALLLHQGPSKGVDPPGGGGDDGGMDDTARLSEVEKAIVRIDATMATLATSADVQKGFTEQTKWIVGSAVVLGAMALTIMTFVLNNAIPKTPVAAAAPIIIQVPVPAAPRASGP